AWRTAGAGRRSAARLLDGAGRVGGGRAGVLPRAAAEAQMTSLATAFLIGLAGSLHCVAMCGPLNVALRVGRATSTQMLYHGGRIAMYALAGAVAGALGHGLMAVGLG